MLQERRTCSAVVKFISAGDKESIYEEGDRKKEGGDGAGGRVGEGDKPTVGRTNEEGGETDFPKQKIQEGTVEGATWLQVCKGLLAQQQDKTQTGKKPRQPDRRWYQQRKQNGMCEGKKRTAKQ